MIYKYDGVLKREASINELSDIRTNAIDDDFENSRADMADEVATSNFNLTQEEYNIVFQAIINNVSNDIVIEYKENGLSEMLNASIMLDLMYSDEYQEKEIYKMESKKYE